MRPINHSQEPGPAHAGAHAAAGGDTGTATPCHRRRSSQPGRWQRGWGICLAAIVLIGLAWLGPTPLLALEGGALFQDRVDYTLTDQSGQDFSGQALAFSSFAGATAPDANFAGADLRGSILTQASFSRADFRGADLTDALMDRVDFSGADFSDALLCGVIAAGSNFSEARIENADFSDALLDRADQRQLCLRAHGTHPVTGVSTRLSLDCR